MPAPEFCHLHVHTQYSLLDGACRIDKLAEKAQRLGMPAVAMTDHGNMFGVVEFDRTLQAHGLKPLIGYEGYFTPVERTVRERTGRGGPELYHLTLLARNQIGLDNLYKLSSLAYIEGFYYKPRIDWQLLRDCAEGLVCLSGCLASRLNQYMLTDRVDEAAQWLGDLRDLFGPEYLFVELQDHGLSEQRQVLGPTMQLARRLDTPVVLTNDCHYLEASDREWHDVLLCISTRKTLDAPDRFRMATDQIYFKTAEEMAVLMPDVPEALSNTLRIAEMCEVQLDDSRKYPVFEQEGVDQADKPAFLRKIATDRLTEGYGELSPQMQERLDEELRIIEEMGYVDYFLIVWDFARFAETQGIPIGMRGSGGGSLTAHAIGLTGINPMDYDLLFSRFLDPERKEAPDIDIDLCEIRREEVIEYARQRYGQSSTAQIITFGTLKPRACVRDVGRVLGVELAKVDRVAKLIPGGPKVTLEEALDDVEDLRKTAREDEEVARILEYAAKLEGMPRHAGIHAAGFVIGDRPLWEVMPLARNVDGTVITQWAMGDLDAMGALKLDFLGLRTLTIIEKARQLIVASGKPAPVIDAGRIDTGDKKTYDFLATGLTQGVFQLGSSGMQRLLKRLKPNCIEDVIALVALYRPGPLRSGMVEDFVERKHGRREVTYPHPAFEPILKPTYGVLVYQEQIMRICNTIAGLSMSAALTLIKAIGKKKEEVIEKEHAAFVEGAVANGVDKQTAEEIFGLILHFAGYGFNKAHASAYAYLAYITAYLKAHHPTEFMAASISCEMGHTEQVVALMEECALLGIDVLPPDVNESGEEFTVVRPGCLRFGLGAVKNVGSKAIECIVSARERGGPFKNLFDFCERVDNHEVGKGVIEALMKAGCFDELPGDRAQQFAIIATAVKVGARVRKDRAIGQSILFGAGGDDPREHLDANLPEVPPLSAQELARQENEALGLYVRHDPLADHRAKLRRFCTVYSDEIEGLADGTQAVMGGVVEHMVRRSTRNKEQMGVLKVLDVHGPFECVLFPRAWEKHREQCAVGSIVFLAGPVGHRRGTSLQVDEVIALDRAQSRLAVSVFVSVPVEEARPQFWQALAAIIRDNRGKVPCYVDITGGGFRLRNRVGNGCTVAASDSLAAQIEELIAPGAVRFGIREPADPTKGQEPWRRRRSASGSRR